MKAGISTEGGILLTTGRISSEMLGKAAKMGAPIMVSRSSPTSLLVELAIALNVMVIGYARRRGGLWSPAHDFGLFHYARCYEIIFSQIFVQLFVHLSSIIYTENSRWNN